MADKSVHVFEHHGGLAVFPSQLPTKGRGADHITLHNHTDFDVHWHVPRGVFDDIKDHDEDIAKGLSSSRQKVKTSKANVVAYKVTLLRQAAAKKKSRRLVSIKSDPIIIIDVSLRKKMAGRRR